MIKIDEENSEDEKLDKKDMEILHILKNNSRETCQSIAKEVLLSNDAVGYRIKKLEQMKVIYGYSIESNNALVKKNKYHIFFSLLESDLAKTEKFKQYLLKIKNIENIYFYSNNWDMEITLLARDIYELDALVSDISKHYSNIIINYEILGKIKNLSSPEKEKELPVKLDNKDLRIMQELSENSRSSVVELAEKVSLNEDTLIYRMKKLVAGGAIKRFVTIINLNKIGLHLYTLLVVMRSFSNQEEKEILDYCKKNENIIYAEKTLGKWNLMIKFVAKDQKDFQKQIFEIKSLLSVYLKDYDILAAYKSLK